MNSIFVPEANTRGPRWERRKERRPGELLDAALALFVERGFAATRLDDVAARAGVSKGTLYLYYASKDELFKAVVRENLVPLIENFRRDIEQSDAPGESLLRNFFEGWWSRVGATRLAGIVKLIMGEAGNFPELAQFFFEEVSQPNLQLLTDIINRGIASGEFQSVDVEVAVHAWMSPLIFKAIWTHSIQPCCPGAHDIPAERFLSAHLDLIMRCLKPGVPTA
jgi:AcrR family transcriptional regulator